MSDQLDPHTRQLYIDAILPWLQRKVFELSCRNDLSYAEIGALTELSPRYIEHQFAKALYKVGKQVDGGKLTWWERLW